MLNPDWENIFEKKDILDWNRLEGSGSIIYPFQREILFRLLNKYFRTEKGNRLNPETSRKINQLMSILRRTMEQLQGAVAIKEDYKARQWEEQKLREMDPEDIRIMQDELRRDSKMQISFREAANIMIDPAKKQEYKPDDAYISEELKKGIKVEKEHSNPNISARDNEEIATEVAKDHLEEDEEYYSKLEEVHKD